MGPQICLLALDLCLLAKQQTALNHITMVTQHVSKIIGPFNLVGMMGEWSGGGGEAGEK